jgi:serine/threonine protein kinase
MSVIYRARDLRLGRKVAVRIVGPDIANDPVVRARLNRASSALASVDHPNVVPIYETGEAEGRLFIVTRWVDGTSLSALVREQGPLEPRRAVRIVSQVASALQAAHAVGIMHRGVKPSSVLVTPTDHAYLTDFGLARRASDLTGLTVQEHLLESFDYLAPEYIEGGDVDARVDIYGLGCVLYEALTGEVPYPGATPAAKMYAHRSADPPSARARRPEVPEELDAVIRRAMAKDPAERLQSAGEFAIVAAGAVRMSAPPWTKGAGAWPDDRAVPDKAVLDKAVPHKAVPDKAVPQKADPAKAQPERADPQEPDYYEPVYVTVGRPAGPRILVAVGMLLFVVAPIALVLAVVAHA